MLALFANPYVAVAAASTVAFGSCAVAKQSTGWGLWALGGATLTGLLAYVINAYNSITVLLDSVLESVLTPIQSLLQYLIDLLPGSLKVSLSSGLDTLFEWIRKGLVHGVMIFAALMLAKRIFLK